MHQNSLFELENGKKILERGHSPQWGHPSTHPTPRRLRRALKPNVDPERGAAALSWPQKLLNGTNFVTSGECGVLMRSVTSVRVSVMFGL